MRYRALFLRFIPVGVLIGFGLVLWSAGTLLHHAWPYLYLLNAQPAPCGCASLQSFSDDPRFFFMLMGVGGLMSLYLLGVGASLAIQLLRTSHFLGALSTKSIKKNDMSAWNEVRSETPLSLTAGLFRPTIYLSTAVTAALSKEEMQSILAHESYHAKHFHPFWRWLLQGLFAPIRWIPFCRDAEQTVILAQEYAADCDAIRKYGKQPLLRAFTKLASSPLPAIPVPSFHITNSRLQLLLEEPVRFPIRIFLGTIVGVLGVLSTAHLAVGAGPALTITPSGSSLPSAQMCLQMVQEKRALRSENPSITCPLLLQSRQ
jgi:hypothetical protein